MINKFSQFEIKTPERGLEGEKIKITKILNREVTVHAYKLEDTKVEAFKKKGMGKCLYLQVSFNNAMYVVFTSGKALLEVIDQVPKDKFPFTTTIVEENGMFKFT
jgi:Tat protein secretion system quality control protein TatD with DNase activity